MVFSSSVFFYGILADNLASVLSDSGKVSEGAEPVAFDCQLDFLWLGRAEIYSAGDGFFHPLQLCDGADCLGKIQAASDPVHRRKPCDSRDFSNTRILSSRR